MMDQLYKGEFSSQKTMFFRVRSSKFRKKFRTRGNPITDKNEHYKTNEKITNKKIIISPKK